MNVDFVGFCLNIKRDVNGLTINALNYFSKSIKELDPEDDAYEIKRLKNEQEDILYQKRRTYSFIDSMHNVLLDIFSQETDAATLNKIKEAKKLLCFSKEWQPKEDCVITHK